MWTENFQMCKLNLEKARNRDQIANICWIIEKARAFQKIIFCLIDYAKAFDCVDHNKLWKTLLSNPLWKKWEYQTTSPAIWETYMQVRKKHVELNMEQQTGSK